MTWFVRGLACVLTIGLAALPRPLLADSPAEATVLTPATLGLTPAQILARYEAALVAAKTPKAMSFEYDVEQLGLRNMEQTHRVYRTALAERDETLEVDGQPLTHPEVRIIAGRIYRYDLHAVAPTRGAYTFAYAGARVDGDEIAYDFTTSPAGTRSFAVSEIELDGRTFLPAVLKFKIANGAVHGSGQLEYGRADTYWVVSDAEVSAHLASGALAHEHIEWSNYQFPRSLPPSTFTPPRAALPPESEAAPTATPSPATDLGAP